MPKIMHINCACTGSTGKIIGDIANHAAGAGYETLLCAPCAPGTNENIRYFRTSLPREQGIYRRLNYVYGFQYGFAPLSTARIKRKIHKEKPDLIHIHCVNGFMVNMYSLFRLLKEKKIPVVITNHAEFFYTGSCPHSYSCEKWMTGCGNCPQKVLATGGKLQDTSGRSWQKMKRALADLEKAVMVSVSPWVADRAKRSPLTAHLPQEVVLNGLNTDFFTYRDRAQLRKQYGFSADQKIIFHPTANFSDAKEDSKGGAYILDLARRLEERNVTVIVAGKYPQGLSIPKNMILLGNVADQVQLAEYYSLADVTVIASKRETFSMPVAESLCSGTPVAGFMAGGPESIALDEHCRFVPQGNMDGLTVAVEALLAKDHSNKEISKQAKQKYGASVMADAYIKIYETLLADRSF